MTIARGHLELLARATARIARARRRARRARPDRADHRAAAAAREGRPAGLPRLDEIDVEPFLEDVFMRWSEIAPRRWRLGALARAGSRRTRRRCARRSTRCSRTRSSTPSRTRRSSCAPRDSAATCDRGRRRRLRHAAGGARADLRALRPRRRRAHAHERRRRPGPVDRRRDRAGARRHLHGRPVAAGSTFALRLPRLEVEQAAPVVTRAAGALPYTRLSSLAQFLRAGEAASARRERCFPRSCGDAVRRPSWNTRARATSMSRAIAPFTIAIVVMVMPGSFPGRRAIDEPRV